MADSICGIFIFQVIGSQSTTTGFKPFLITAIKLETIVKFGIITSSPFFKSRLFTAISKAAVPLDTVDAYFFFYVLRKFFFK